MLGTSQSFSLFAPVRELLGGQKLLDGRQQISSPCISRCRCRADPRIRSDQVLGRAAPVRIQETQFDARSGMSLQGRFLKPGKRCRIVLSNAFPAKIQVRKIILAKWISRLRRLSIKLDRFAQVAFTRDPLIVKISEVGCGAAVSGFGAFLKPAKGLCVVLPHSPAVEIQESQIVVRAGELLVGRCSEPVLRSSIVHRRPPAVHVHDGKVHLRRGISPLSGPFKPLEGLLLVVVRSDGQDRSNAQLVLGKRLPLAGHLLHDFRVAHLFSSVHQARDDRQAALFRNRLLPRASCRQRRHHHNTPHSQRCTHRGPFHRISPATGTFAHAWPNTCRKTAIPQCSPNHSWMPAASFDRKPTSSSKNLMTNDLLERQSELDRVRPRTLKCTRKRTSRRWQTTLQIGRTSVPSKQISTPVSCGSLASGSSWSASRSRFWLFFCAMPRNW